MKQLFLSLFLCLAALQVNAQTCEEMMTFVKKKSTGTTYNSYTSEAISKVTFYNITIDYKTLYFAIVCFKQKHSYGCNEYIYKVSSSTKINYSMNYLSSAGKAFWNYIEPYSENLKCAPNFE